MDTLSSLDLIFYRKLAPICNPENSDHLHYFSFLYAWFPEIDFFFILLAFRLNQFILRLGNYSLIYEISKLWIQGAYTLRAVHSKLLI